MINSINSSLSALRAFSKKMEVTSNNVANVESEEFKKSRAVMKEGVNGGVVVEISKVETPGSVIIEKIGEEATERELSNVEVGEEMTQMIMTQRAYEANIEAAKTDEKMLGSLIDIMS